MEMLNLKEEKLKYNSMTQKLSRAQIKNHLIELGKNPNQKMTYLCKLLYKLSLKKLLSTNHQLP